MCVLMHCRLCRTATIVYMCKSVSVCENEPVLILRNFETCFFLVLLKFRFDALVFVFFFFSLFQSLIMPLFKPKWKKQRIKASMWCVVALINLASLQTNRHFQFSTQAHSVKKTVNGAIFSCLYCANCWYCCCYYYCSFTCSNKSILFVWYCRTFL